MQQMGRFVFAALLGALAACNSPKETSSSASALTASAAPSVGLSLYFVNGQMAPLNLLSGSPRYLSEIDIVSSAPAGADDGVAALMSGELAGLDWSGVRQVEEIWAPAMDGTLTRERYFRGAAWMDGDSTFTLQPLGADGQPLGQALRVHAGRDAVTDDDDVDGSFVVRRFSARHVASRCSLAGDCSGGSFRADAVISLRDPKHPGRRAMEIPPEATALRLAWSAEPGQARTVAISSSPRSAWSYGYGFQIALEPVSTPANGSFYLPGEQVSLRMVFKDGEGNNLFPDGRLPSYGEFFFGAVPSGVRYLDLITQAQARLYYALKHRESNPLFIISGPVDKLKTASSVVDPNLFFAPEVPFANAAQDGYSAVGQTVPSAAIVFGGFFNPMLWGLPTSDVFTAHIPADAQPGTWLAAFKARREFGGEALNRGAVLELQVGQAEPTSFQSKTRCAECHESEEGSGFGQLLHGLSDRRACFGCHPSLGIEFDNALDIRVHTIHDRSKRFPGRMANCATCHLAPPAGPQRGVLP